MGALRSPQAASSVFSKPGLSSRWDEGRGVHVCADTNDNGSSRPAALIDFTETMMKMYRRLTRLKPSHVKRCVRRGTYPSAHFEATLCIPILNRYLQSPINTSSMSASYMQTVRSKKQSQYHVYFSFCRGISFLSVRDVPRDKGEDCRRNGPRDMIRPRRYLEQPQRVRV